MIFPLCYKCKSQLVMNDYYVDKYYKCKHNKEYGFKGKYNCKCGAWGEYVDILEDKNCDMCDRFELLEKSSKSPEKGYTFHVKNMKCNGHYCKIEYCDFTCYDCKKSSCCCYGVYHCCCNGDSDSNSD